MFRCLSLLAFTSFSLALTAPVGAQSSGLEASPAWDITITTSHWGELSGIFDVEAEGRVLGLRPGSELAEYLASTATLGEWFRQGEIVSLRVNSGNGPHFGGRLAGLEATFDRGYQNLEFDLHDGEIAGRVTGNGAFSGSLRGSAHAAYIAPYRDYRAIAARLNELMREKLFDPRLLDDAGSQLGFEILRRTGEGSRDDFDFILGHAFGAPRLPFSHFEILRPEGGLPALLERRANRGAGGHEVELSFRRGVAVLKVDSFVGERIGRQIEESFAAIAAQSPSALIIDLRENSGGSLAGAALANHLIPQGRTIGAFVTGQWYLGHDSAPTESEIAAAPVWQGRSLEDFYAGLDEHALMRVVAEPAETIFAGPVYVLLSGQSGSMTELVAAALADEANVTLVGENTAGAMLSSRFFDLGDGYAVRIPIADYYTVSGVRIEGVGVAVDIAVEPRRALDRARELAAAD